MTDDRSQDDRVVVDNRVANRFELTVGDATAFLLYERAPGVLTLVHTEVPPDLRGRHLGDRLAEAALEAGLRRAYALLPSGHSCAAI